MCNPQYLNFIFQSRNRYSSNITIISQVLQQKIIEADYPENMNEENVSKEFTSQHQFFQGEFATELEVCKAQNYVFLIQYLSLWKKQNIVPYHFIKYEKGKILEIGTKRGDSLNYDLGWFGQDKKCKTSAKQKLNMLADVCKGFINLASVKIIHPDICLRNLIRIKSQFYIIDFVQCLLIGRSKLLSSQKNYLNKSQLEQLQEKLILKSRQIISLELKQYLEKREFPKHLNTYLQMINHKITIINIINSHNKQQPLSKLVDQIFQYIQANLQKIYVKQLQELIKIFNQDQKKQIQKIRENIRSQNEFARKRITMDEIIEKHTSNCKYGSILTEFYNELMYTKKPMNDGAQIEVDNKQFKAYLAKINLMRKKKKRQNISQKNQQQSKRPPIKNIDRPFMERIQSCLQYFDQKRKKIVNLLSDSQYIKIVSFIDIIEINQTQTVIPDNIDDSSLYLFQNTNRQPEIPQLRLQRIDLIDLIDKKELYQLKNNQENYAVLQLLLLYYLQNQIKDSNLVKPNSFIKRQDNKITLYSQEKQHQFGQDWHKIRQISTRGFKHILKYIKDVTQDTIMLDAIGLFHPNITMSNIHSKEYRQNQNFKFRIGNLIDCFYISNHFQLSQSQEQLLLINKYLITQYFCDCLKQQAGKQNFPFTFKFRPLKNISKDIRKNIFAQPQQNQKSQYQFADNDLQFRKASAMFTHLSLVYGKIHAEQIGNIFIQFFKIERQITVGSNNQQQRPKDFKYYIPKFLQKKWQKLQKLVSDLKHSDEKKRICASRFYQELILLFKTCQQNDHKDQIIYYYCLKANTSDELLLCDKCIDKSSQQNSQFYCHDHHLPLSFMLEDIQEENPQFKKYYCKKCELQSIPNFKLKTISPKSLEQYQNICLQFDCPQTLFSNSQKKIHADHKTLTFPQFKDTCSQINTESSKDKQAKSKLSRHSINLKLQKSFRSHQQEVNNIFEKLHFFSEKNSSKLSEIVNLNKLQSFCKNNEGRIDSTQENKALIFDVMKVILHLHDCSQKQGFSAISFEGYLEYATQQFKSISNQIYDNIKSQLDSVIQTLKKNLFSNNIQQKVKSFLDNKYKQVNQKHIESKQVPSWFKQIPDKCDQIVGAIKLTRFQKQIQEFAMEKFDTTSFIDQLFHEKFQKYKQWICLMQQEQKLIFNCSINIQEQNALNYYYTKYKLKYLDIVRIIILQTEKLNQLKKPKYKKKIFPYLAHQQRYKNQIIQQKIQILQYQNLYADKLLDRLKKLQDKKKQLCNFLYQSVTPDSKFNVQSSIDSIKKQHRVIIDQLQNALKRISTNLIYFHTIFKVDPISLSSQQVSKIQKLKNLQKIELSLERNYNNFIFSKHLADCYFISQLDIVRILSKNSNLKQIQIHGGHLDLSISLKAIQQNSRAQFTLHADVQNSVKQSSQLQQIASILRKQKIRLSCINIRIKRNLSEMDKQAIIDIVSRVKEVKLDIIGPFSKNEFALAILEKIASIDNLVVTALQIKNLDLQKQQKFFKNLGKNCISLKIKNCRCFNILLKQCSSKLKYIWISDCGSINSLADSGSIAAISQCLHLESIEFNNSVFNSDFLDLIRLDKLKNIHFRICPGVQMGFLQKLHSEAIKNLVNFEVSGYCFLQQSFFTVISKMSSLRSLQVSQCGILLVDKIPNLSLPNLQMLYIRQKIESASDQFLKEIYQKWPKLIALAIPSSKNITLTIFQFSFLSLKYLSIPKRRYSYQQKYQLARIHQKTQRKVQIEEYN